MTITEVIILVVCLQRGDMDSVGYSSCMSLVSYVDQVHYLYADSILCLGIVWLLLWGMFT